MAFERKIIGKTAKCIICLEDAEIYTGHVQKGNDDVIAGWCKSHQDVYLLDLNNTDRDRFVWHMNIDGCHGGWHESYGLTPYMDGK